MEILTQERTLRSNNFGPCVDHGEKNTFQDQAKNTFYKLPINIRSYESKIIFNWQARDFVRAWLLLGLWRYINPPYNLLSIR